MGTRRSYYYDINKKYLMLIGQWPYQKPKEKLFYFTFIITLAFSSIVPQIKDLTDHLFVDWDILETKEEHDIMRKYAEKGRWYALIYGSFVYMSITTFATTTLVPRVLDVVFPLNTSRSVMLPYPAYYFVDENQYFNYIFLHMLLTSNVCMTGLIAHDSMFFVYVEHICGLFAVVGFVQFLESTFTISLAVQLLLVTIGLSITLVQVAQFFHCDGNARCIKLTIPMFMLMVTLLAKLYTFQFNRSKIKSLTDQLCDDWKKLNSAEEYEIMKKYATNARLITVVYLNRKIYNRKIAISIHAHWRAIRFAKILEDIFCTAFAVQMLIVTVTLTITLLQVRIYLFVIAIQLGICILRAMLFVLLHILMCVNIFILISLMPTLLNIVLPLNESRLITMPYDAYYFVDEEKYYFYIICHMTAGLTIALLALLAHDCALFIYIEHVCSLFAVVGFAEILEDLFCTAFAVHMLIYVVTLSITLLQIKSLTDHLYDDWEKLNNAEEYEIMKKYATNAKLITLAYILQNLFPLDRFAEILEDMFCTALAIQMLIVVITLSITLLQVVLHYGDIKETLKYLAFIVAQVIHTFCYSLQGQRLINHSIQLRDKVYNSSWYEIPAESRKLLLFVMRRSMEPCFLSAGKIFIFSLKSFTTVNII
ncbi:Putative odorant receptor 42b [Trachymyrmex cornetzi]|uniref:Putative odorant receptor 42b n=1 Tax=Trachymyrmex cornetzi TaxID=471704 RepID=A0A195EIJ4_9HYME|nr:Putative odorant receptor 42b [Trachymyrmex cornetzi]